MKNRLSRGRHQHVGAGLKPAPCVASAGVFGGGGLRFGCGFGMDGVIESVRAGLKSRPCDRKETV